MALALGIILPPVLLRPQVDLGIDEPTQLIVSSKNLNIFEFRPANSASELSRCAPLFVL